LNATSESMSSRWAHYQLLGELAKQRNTENILQHFTTDNVARDMLRITQAFGFEKLQNWGVSYGSVLGVTFATLFPDKVGRLAIDGVMDTEAWHTANFTGGMADTNKTLQSCFDGCAAAGPDRCAYYAPTAAEIAANLDSLTESLRAQPIPVLTNISHGAVDYSFIRAWVYFSLLGVYKTFLALAQGLADLAAGNATMAYKANDVAALECDCDASGVPFTNNVYEASVTVLCNDAEVVNDSISDPYEFYENEAKLSSFAEVWAAWRVYCSGWKVHPEGRSSGPGGANTSFPLLVIGNTADSLTSIVFAKKAVGLFPGSVLLTQDSPGHTSLVAPSLCTHGALRAYFQDGTLPKEGIVCPVDAELFPGAANAMKRTL
ncbi:TAP-like protein-domain-containing protein, partial [Mycena olivaceomarginata]